MDVSRVRTYLERQWTRILIGRISLFDFVFAKEVRLGTYSANATLPPAALVATQRIARDPRAEPLYAQRVPYVVIDGAPGSRLVDLVVSPASLITGSSGQTLNAIYYITRQINPALARVFDLIGVDIRQWFERLPRPRRRAPPLTSLTAQQSIPINAAAAMGAARSYRNKHGRLLPVPGAVSAAAAAAGMFGAGAGIGASNKSTKDQKNSSSHCALCDELTTHPSGFCRACLSDPAHLSYVMNNRLADLQRAYTQTLQICYSCHPAVIPRSVPPGAVRTTLRGTAADVTNPNHRRLTTAVRGGDAPDSTGYMDVECVSLDCAVMYERHKLRTQLTLLQHQMQTMNGFLE
jgi:DNA polymerase zeta